MNIYGIGTDIVSVNRIKKSLKNKNFLKRIFSQQEIIKCNKVSSIYNCYAKRFAAKESFSKALGTGISNGINFNEIVILNKKTGFPQDYCIPSRNEVCNWLCNWVCNWYATGMQLVCNWETPG